MSLAGGRTRLPVALPLANAGPKNKTPPERNPAAQERTEQNQSRRRKMSRAAEPRPNNAALDGSGMAVTETMSKRQVPVTA